MSKASLASVHPRYAIAGGRVAILGAGFDVDWPSLPGVRIGGRQARIVFASPTRLDVRVPHDLLEHGVVPVSVDGSAEAMLEVARPAATGLHQVDSPVVDRHGALFVTFSGTRGQRVPVSIFRVGLNGTRETYSSGVVNPTSMALDREGQLFVSSRFEGTVYRIHEDGTAERFATDLGIACGLAFAPDGTLFVGDRSGTIFAVDRLGHARPFATLPPSVAAFHLALGPDALYVAGPTLSPSDAVYHIGFNGEVAVHSRAFGRPQGLAVSPEGTLFVVEALAGASGLYRVPDAGPPTLELAGSVLVGVTFDPSGGLFVSSSDTVYRVPGFC
jgi:DNA-binding beta-propeller fold protein YncE